MSKIIYPDKFHPKAPMQVSVETTPEDFIACSKCGGTFFIYTAMFAKVKMAIGRKEFVTAQGPLLCSSCGNITDLQSSKTMAEMKQEMGMGEVVEEQVPDNKDNITE